MSKARAAVPGTLYGWLVGFAASWVVLAVLGRLLVVDQAALVWPALGLSITWFLVRRVGFRSLDTVVLAAAAFATLLLSGSPLGVAVIGAVTNGLQAPAAVALLRRWLPGLDPLTGVRGLDSAQALARFFGAVLVPVVLAAVVGVVGLVLLGLPTSPVLGPMLVGRNLCGGLAVSTLTLVLLAPVLTRRRPHRPDTRAVAEGAGAFVLAAALLWLDTVATQAPVGFLVLGVAVWVGTRCGVVVNVWFAATTGAAVVAATLFDAGTFAAASSEVGGLLSQLFVVAVFGICLALATGRVETARLQAALADAAADAAERAAFLDATMAAVHEGILVIDEQRTVTFANPAAGRLLGVDPDAELAWLAPFTSFVVDGGQVPADERPIARALRGEDVQDTEAWVGEDPPRVLSFGARQLSSPGRDPRAVLTVRDVTTEHAQRESLETFAGVVAHDLQNPLAAIDGWVDLLADHLSPPSGADGGDPTTAAFLARIRTSSARMRALIGELLAYATVKDKQLDPQDVDLAEVVTQIAHERGRVGQVVSGPLPTVCADPTLVYQLLDNLIGNALKFTAPGVEPHVIVRAALGPARDGLTEVEVTDNGTGIPNGLHDEVFSEFRRAHGASHRGHGLGLAICRRIVTRHGGAISAHDRADASGTTFRFSLPAAAPVPASAPAA